MDFITSIPKGKEDKPIIIDPKVKGRVTLNGQEVAYTLKPIELHDHCRN